MRTSRPARSSDSLEDSPTAGDPPRRSSEPRRKYRRLPTGGRRGRANPSRSRRHPICTVCGVADDTARYEYPDVLRSVAETYRPAAVGRRRSDGEWEGRIEFVAESGVKRVSTDVETTQPDAEAFRYWANGIGVAYLEGALARALGPRTASATTPAAEPRSPTAHALLDPFAVHAQGERLLEDQLNALETDHIRNIVRAYRIASPDSAASLSRSDLTGAILAAVQRNERQPKSRTSRDKRGKK